MTIRGIVLSDNLLTQNLVRDDPDAFGLEDDRSWSQIYDDRTASISRAIVRALRDGEFINDGFAATFVPSTTPKYTASETLALMVDYHTLLSNLSAAKAGWLDDQGYDNQNLSLFAYKTLLETCCPK